MSGRTLNQLYIRRFLDAHFAVDRGYRLILDLGCGASPYGGIYGRNGVPVISADLFPGPGVTVCLEAEYLPFRDGSFDCIVLTEVLEHVANADLTIDEIHRVLSPGGTLILTAPFLYGIHEQPRDFRRYTEFGLAQLLTAHGFQIRVLERRGNLVDVGTTVLSHFLLLGFEGLARIPFLQWIFRPLNGLGRMLVFGALRVQFSATSRMASLHPPEVGENLTMGGHLALWTLGYDVVAEKTAEPT